MKDQKPCSAELRILSTFRYVIMQIKTCRHPGDLESNALAYMEARVKDIESRL